METAERIIRWVEQLAPKSLAIGDDPVGWQIGDPQRKVDHVLIALELTTPVVEYAIKNNVQLIITHHPVFFRPLKSLRLDDPKGKLIATCISNQICVYSAHTNLDVAQNGLNDWLAELFELQEIKSFSQTRFDPHHKLIVYVPVEAEQAVAEAMFDAGAGWIGNYSHCSFRQQGTGTFQPHEGTNPYQGKAGKLESVQEVRFETIVPSDKIDEVIRAMTAAHPYEEVAYDLFKLEGVGTAQAIGRIGKLTEAAPLDHFAFQIKQTLGLENIRFVGNAEKMIRNVAVIGGAARNYWKAAMQAGADVFITGDVDYHTAVDILEAGFAIIDPGHHVESLMQEQLAMYLRNHIYNEIFMTDLQITSYPLSNNPFQFL